MIGLFFLGFASGLPRLLVYSTLTFWLMEVGLDIKAVGLFSATATPYNLKFLWAPLLDRLRIPGLAAVLGNRRAWMLVTQLGLVVTIAGMALTNPAVSPLWTGILAIAVATLSASQDVVIDAYRVELLEDEAQGSGAAMAVFGYRIAMLVAGAGALYLATWSGNWTTTYLVMAAFMGVGLLTTLLVSRPPIELEPESGLRAHIVDGIIGPFRDFLTRPSWGLVVLFVLTFKLGDSLAGTMTNPFLIDIGFSKIEIADVSKVFGVFASLIGVSLGGLLVRRAGIVGALWVAGGVQLLSNFMFCLQAYLGRNIYSLIAMVGFENLTGGLGTAAFVAYLSSLCNKRYTATQYALLTAMSSVLHTILGMGTGYVVASLDWFWYFALTALVAVPGLVFLWLLRRLDAKENVNIGAI
jgi:PAT family beta-lactamase induction signal transducer AmpG